MAYFHSPTIVTSGLVLCLDAANGESYPGSGTAWTDLSGNGNNGTLVNGPVFEGAGLGSISFDGVDDRMNSLSGTFFTDPSTESITISIWMYIPSDAVWSNGNRGTIFGKGATAGSFGLVRSVTDNQVQFWIRGITSGNGGGITSINRDEWVNIVGTWSNSISSIYKNGIFQNSSTLSIVGGLDTSLYYIGLAINFSGSTGNFFKGSVSQLSIYNRALSAAEILQNYNATKGRYGL
jgi:hypothetical protein